MEEWVEDRITVSKKGCLNRELCVEWDTKGESGYTYARSRFAA